MRLILVSLSGCIALSILPIVGAQQADESLKQAVGDRFLIGAGISDRIADQANDHELLMRNFRIVTAENCMKPQSLQRRPGEWDFEVADRFVEFASQHDLQVVGHCLLWAKDDRTWEWYFKDGEQTADGDFLRRRIRDDIQHVAGRYKGRIAMWDVVNEVLADGEDGYLRPSGYVAACGETFIAEAFHAAHEADPDALLIYNDYNTELASKRPKMLRLLESLQSAQVPIHAVGLQGHYELDRIPMQELDDTITAIKSLGLKVVISELDIDVIPRGRWWAENGKFRDELSQLNPYAAGCPDDILQRQADQYAALFRLFAKHSDTVIRVSFWNLHDGESWLNDFPWRRVNHPLLFDRDRQPKPAFRAVLDALRQEPDAADATSRQ